MDVSSLPYTSPKTQAADGVVTLCRPHRRASHPDHFWQQIGTAGGAWRVHAKTACA